MDQINKFRIHPIGSEEREEQEVSVMSPELDFKDIQWQGGGEMGGWGTFWGHRGQLRGHGGRWGRTIRTWTSTAPEPRKERELAWNIFDVESESD